MKATLWYCWLMSTNYTDILQQIFEIRVTELCSRWVISKELNSDQTMLACILTGEGSSLAVMAGHS